MTPHSDNGIAMQMTEGERAATPIVCVFCLCVLCVQFLRAFCECMRQFFCASVCVFENERVYDRTIQQCTV